MAAASSPSPNDSGCAEQSCGLPREGERGEEPLPAPRAAGNPAPGAGSQRRETGGRDRGGGSRPPDRAGPPSRAASPTRSPATGDRGPRSRGASGRRHSRELTQSRSLGPSLRPTRRWERSNKSRSRRAEREDAPPTNDQTALRSKPPDASIFIETLHAASVRHRTLICIHQRLFRLAGAFADALTSPHTKAVLRGRFLIGRGLGH